MRLSYLYNGNSYTDETYFDAKLPSGEGTRNCLLWVFWRNELSITGLHCIRSNFTLHIYISVMNTAIVCEVTAYNSISEKCLLLLITEVSNILKQPWMASHKGHGILNHQQLDCLFSGLFRLTAKKTSKLYLNGPNEENHPWQVGSPPYVIWCKTKILATNFGTICAWITKIGRHC